MKISAQISAYSELSKPRILTLILVTTALGFFLGGKGIHSWPLLILTLVGAAGVAAGASALNQYLEKDADSKMQRTKNRPLPTGFIAPAHALSYGIILVLLGVCFLWWKVNLLTAFLSLLTAFLYVLVYTPMKRLTWLNTSMGAIAGAIPPMGGWAAATGELGIGAWVLFLLLFVWQHPHFYSIAWIFKDDYARAGFQMLPVIEKDGKRTFRQINVYSLFLIPIALLPTMIGMAGKIYFSGALAASLVLFSVGFGLSRTKSSQDARRLLRTSVIYLPFLFFLIILDVSF